MLRKTTRRGRRDCGELAVDGSVTDEESVVEYTKDCVYAKERTGSKELGR